VGLEQGQSFNGPSWSISTEWVVNLLFFALICMRRRPAAAIFLAIVVACCGGPVGAAGWHLAPSLQRTMCGFFICALLQYVLGARIDEARVRPAWHWDASLIALLAGLATMAIHGGSFSAGFLDRIGGKYAIFGIAVVLAPIGLVSSRLLGLGILKFCGEISYSIYLVHFSLELGLAILERALGVRLPVDSGWFLILFLVGTVVVSWATYRWVEVPGKRLVRTWAAAFST
jgi:peptidoglycan/LPS O-acetylase OafA/YrhL